MKLWILSPAAGREQDPWEPWYDAAFGFVVRAGTETEARKFADEQNGAEGHAWLDPKLSTCEELAAAGEPGVVMRDFASA